MVVPIRVVKRWLGGGLARHLELTGGEGVRSGLADGRQSLSDPGGGEAPGFGLVQVPGEIIERDDADQLTVRIDDWQTPELPLSHRGIDAFD